MEALDLLDLMVTVPGMDQEAVTEKMEDREERMAERMAERMEETGRKRIRIVELDLMSLFKKSLILRILVIQ